MFDKQVQETTSFEPQTINDVYEFVKSVYEYVIPENKEAGEHGFNVLDYIAMEQLGAWLKQKEKADAALTVERDVWKELAGHQIPCGSCAENVYECDTALALMLKISKLSSTANEWVDDPRVEEYAAALGEGEEA